MNLEQNRSPRSISPCPPSRKSALSERSRCTALGAQLRSMALMEARKVVLVGDRHAAPHPREPHLAHAVAPPHLDIVYHPLRTHQHRAAAAGTGQLIAQVPLGGEDHRAPPAPGITTALLP